MDAIDFFVLHYGRLHRQVERDFLHGLGDAQMRLRPHGLNSIAWLVWHMARCEDALSIVLVGRPQVLDEEDWGSLGSICRFAISEPVWPMTRCPT
jgi:hypothetical protein